ncbi:MAG: hydrogenase maturation nickel metallochaperone HypA [Anaerolineae bacterium]
MHELPVTEGILRIAIEHAEQAGAQCITDIHLVIGDLAGFVDDSIQFYFDILTPGTLAEGAKLHFHRVATRLRCWECGREFSPPERDWTCPQCGAMGGEVLAGKEFYVESIEIE